MDQWESKMPKQACVIIEKFRNGDPVPLYRRCREIGRFAPEGVTYVSSRVDSSLTRCYHVMETDDRKSFDEWMDN
jgi:hypothetical protein